MMLNEDRWQLGEVTKGRSTMHILAIRDARAMLNSSKWSLHSILYTAGQLMTWQGTEADMLQVAACEQYIHGSVYADWLDEWHNKEENRYA